MASLLDVLIFDAVYGSWILSLPLFTLGITDIIIILVSLVMTFAALGTGKHKSLQLKILESSRIRSH